MTTAFARCTTLTVYAPRGGEAHTERRNLNDVRGHPTGLGGRLAAGARAASRRQPCRPHGRRSRVGTDEWIKNWRGCSILPMLAGPVAKDPKLRDRDRRYVVTVLNEEGRGHPETGRGAAIGQGTSDYSGRSSARRGWLIAIHGEILTATCSTLRAARSAFTAIECSCRSSSRGGNTDRRLRAVIGDCDGEFGVVDAVRILGRDSSWAGDGDPGFIGLLRAIFVGHAAETACGGGGTGAGGLLPVGRRGRRPPLVKRI